MYIIMVPEVTIEASTIAVQHRTLCTFCILVRALADTDFEACVPFESPMFFSSEPAHTKAGSMASNLSLQRLVRKMTVISMLLERTSCCY